MVEHIIVQRFRDFFRKYFMIQIMCCLFKRLFFVMAESIRTLFYIFSLTECHFVLLDLLEAMNENNICLSFYFFVDSTIFNKNKKGNSNDNRKGRKKKSRIADR